MADAAHWRLHLIRSFCLSGVPSASHNVFVGPPEPWHRTLHQERAVISRVQDLFEEAQEHETAANTPLACRQHWLENCRAGTYPWAWQTFCVAQLKLIACPR